MEPGEVWIWIQEFLVLLGDSETTPEPNQRAANHQFVSICGEADIRLACFVSVLIHFPFHLGFTVQLCVKLVAGGSSLAEVIDWSHNSQGRFFLEIRFLSDSAVTF